MQNYKTKLAGIRVKPMAGSYTNKYSIGEKEPLGKHCEYKGKQIKCGLFSTGGGRLMNADVNGKANIVRKAFPNALAEGIEGVVVRPVRVTPYKWF